MRYLAIDLGDRRTGIAAGDSVLRLASPVRVIEVPTEQRGGEALLDAIVAAVEEQLGPARGGGAGELVIGLPLNMDGTEGPRAKLVRAFAARVTERTGRAVRFQDERLTSAAADWSMARSGLTRGQKKDRRDAIAAAVMLQGFLDALGRERGAE
ncbi:MAG: Holliday junction resolvase RuvX [Phycisphaerales bacterium]